jgi:hypothetical protein
MGCPVPHWTVLTNEKDEEERGIKTNNVRHKRQKRKTNRLTPWSRILPEKLTGPQLVK